MTRTLLIALCLLVPATAFAEARTVRNFVDVIDKPVGNYRALCKKDGGKLVTGDEGTLACLIEDEGTAIMVTHYNDRVNAWALMANDPDRGLFMLKGLRETLGTEDVRRREGECDVRLWLPLGSPLIYRLDICSTHATFMVAPNE